MKKLLRRILLLTVTLGFCSLLALGITYLVIAPDLPDVESMRDMPLQVPLRIYSADGKLISIFGEKRRIPVGIADVPAQMKNAFIAGEDARFYEHPGVDYQGLTRAVWTLASTGEKTIGGSTITQILARNYFLSLEKTYSRKIREIFLALQIEQRYSKDEILEMFLNKILLGHRAYGVGAAAEVYYGKTLDELSLAQCAMIAALPKAPSRINPITSPERALERRNYVLSRMLELGYISSEEHAAAVAEPDEAFYHGPITEVSAPYLAEMVRQEVLRLLGEDAYTGGYLVHTTVDSRLQTAANAAVRDGLEDYDRRHGYRGPEARLDLPPDAPQSALEQALAPYQAVAGLVPGLVTEVSDDFAVVQIKSNESIALELPQVGWARKFISRDRYGNKPAKVSEVLARGDLIRLRRHADGQWHLGQLPDSEAALVSLDVNTGAIRALVGGYDFYRSKFNRITQSRRQPGSSFKPFVYSAALERGFTTASIINDAPVVFEDSELERTWKPQNYGEEFSGPIRLREAMVESRNLVSIRLLQDMGIAFAREYISGFGFREDELPENLSMALGSASVTPLSMARGLAAFANSGYLIDPHFITRIEDAEGRVIHRSNPALICEDCSDQSAPLAPEPDAGAEEDTGEDTGTPAYRPLEIAKAGSPGGTAAGLLPEAPREEALIAPRIISEQNAYLVRSMMSDVIARGTGKQALELGRQDLAGKTGTTNDQRDAWFSGYNGLLLTTVWVGFDDHQPLGRSEVGGRAALPVWIQYMRVALEGMPPAPAALPPGIVQARINPRTGLIVALDKPGAVMEVFQSGRLPELEASLEGADPDATTEQSPYDIY